MVKWLLAFLVILPMQAWAIDKNTIRVVVNNEIITQYDVEIQKDRFLRESGLKEDISTESEVVRQLIIDKLRSQLATRNRIPNQYQLVDRRIDEVAKSQGKSIDEFKQFLSDTGDNYDQIRELLNQRFRWAALVNQEYYNNNEITPAQIQERIDFLKTQSGQEQKLIHEIRIPFLRNIPKNEIIANAARLVSEFRQGRNFEAVSSALKNQGINEGGELGWLYIDQLEYQFQDIVRSVRVGSIVGPAELNDGVSILKIVGERKLAFDENTINKEEISAQLENEKRTQIEQRITNQLWSDSLIEIR